MDEFIVLLIIAQCITCFWLMLKAADSDVEIPNSIIALWNRGSVLGKAFLVIAAIWSIPSIAYIAAFLAVVGVIYGICIAAFPPKKEDKSDAQD